MFSLLIRKVLSEFLDRPFFYFIISITWIIFSFMPIYFIFIFPDFFFFHLGGIDSILRIPFFWLLLLYWPLTRVMIDIIRITGTAEKKIDFSIFLKSFKKNCLSGLISFTGLILIHNLFFFNYRFYFHGPGRAWPFSFFFFGLLLWGYLVFLFLAFYYLPFDLHLKKKRYPVKFNLFFSLLFDNIKLTFFLFFFFITLTIIFYFIFIGFLFLFLPLYTLFTLIALSDMIDKSNDEIKEKIFGDNGFSLYPVEVKGFGEFLKPWLIKRK